MDLLIPLALAALLIFFLFNSRRKQKARMEQIKTNLVPGASVMTTFGVFGTVVAIDEENNQVTIESGPGTTLKVHRQAIGQIDSPEAAAPAETAPGSDAPADPADAPAITDAELDAMIERKRAESGDSADAENGASPVGRDAEHPAAGDEAPADSADTADEGPVKDADADAGSEEPGSDEPGTDTGKKN